MIRSVATDALGRALEPPLVVRVDNPNELRVVHARPKVERSKSRHDMVTTSGSTNLGAA